MYGTKQKSPVKQHVMPAQTLPLLAFFVSEYCTRQGNSLGCVSCVIAYARHCARSADRAINGRRTHTEVWYRYRILKLSWLTWHRLTWHWLLDHLWMESLLLIWLLRVCCLLIEGSLLRRVSHLMLLLVCDWLRLIWRYSSRVHGFLLESWRW